MTDHTTLPISASSGFGKPSAASTALAANRFSKKTRRIFTLPGLTGPVVLVGSPRTKSAQKGTICHDLLSLAADIFDLRGWRKMDPLACFMLAGYAAVIAQPLVFGSLGSSIVALMTPTK
jgi:hypothetical protein